MPGERPVDAEGLPIPVLEFLKGEPFRLRPPCRITCTQFRLRRGHSQSHQALLGLYSMHAKLVTQSGMRRSGVEPAPTSNTGDGKPIS